MTLIYGKALKKYSMNTKPCPTGIFFLKWQVTSPCQTLLKVSTRSSVAKRAVNKIGKNPSAHELATHS